MEDSLRTGLEYFFPGACYNTVIVEHEFFNSQCLKMAFSRSLSLTVIFGALIVKVPQIFNILRAGSVEGLTYFATLLELLAVTFTCTYNLAKGFNFSSWGESFFILVQVLVILALMFNYNRQLYLLAIFAPVYGIMCWYLTSDYASLELLGMLQASVIFLLLSSRLSQVYTIYSNKSTGQLSLITSFLNWAGTLSRIFTTLQETQDPIILAMFISSFTVNGIILLQFFIYWNSGSGKRTKKE